MIRKKIIYDLDKPVEYFHLYYKFKTCIKFEDGVTTDSFGRNLDTLIDDWFDGVIHSLFYRTNRKVLILVKQDCDDCFQFLSEMMYNKELFLSIALRETKSIYSSLICEYTFTKNSLNIASEDNFVVNDSKDSYPIVDKRLCSYCNAVSKWVYPERKNFIVLKVKSIDFDTFSSINKLDLWIEIFKKFMP